MRLATRLHWAAFLCAITIAGAAAQTESESSSGAKESEAKTEQSAKPGSEKAEEKTEEEKPPLTDPPVREEPEPEVSVLPCVTPAIASDQIIKFLNVIAARITTGELMPWDAREASEALGSASDMLARDDLEGACAQIADVQHRYKL